MSSSSAKDQQLVITLHQHRIGDHRQEDQLQEEEEEESLNIIHGDKKQQKRKIDPEAPTNKTVADAEKMLFSSSQSQSGDQSEKDEESSAIVITPKALIQSNNQNSVTKASPVVSPQSSSSVGGFYNKVFGHEPSHVHDQSLLKKSRLVGSLDTQQLSLVNNNKSQQIRRVNSQDTNAKRKGPLVRQMKCEEEELPPSHTCGKTEEQMETGTTESLSPTGKGRPVRLFIGSQELKTKSDEEKSASSTEDIAKSPSSPRVPFEDQEIISDPDTFASRPLLPRPTRLNTMPSLQRALTLPSSCEDRHPLKSPRRHCGPPITERDFEEDTVIEIPVCPPSGMTSPNARRASLDNLRMKMVIPTFTVTINPMTADEMTFVPESPSSSANNRKLNSSTSKDDGAKTPSPNPSPVPNWNEKNSLSLEVQSPPNEDEIRRSSIGSASSLILEEKENENLLGVPRTLSIRRVSEISHIKELRQEMSGMEHLASEYYEISREPNPDAISLDSIHKTVFKRCRNKYIPLQRSTTRNKCFVIVTSGFTILGIIYGFWYKNFGPGKDDPH